MFALQIHVGEEAHLQKQSDITRMSHTFIDCLIELYQTIFLCSMYHLYSRSSAYCLVTMREAYAELIYIEFMKHDAIDQLDFLTVLK